MIRIGLIGSASVRADIFSRLLNIDLVVGDRARVAAIWNSADPERTEAVARENGIPEVARSLHDLADRVDAAIIVDRHGDLHAEHALPFLLDGKPVHVVPPLAIDLFDCRRMMSAAGRSGAALTSFSSLAVAPATEALARALPGSVRLAQLAGPGGFGGPHGGPFFAAPHVFELATALLGERVVALRAVRVGEAVAVDAVWERDELAMLALVASAEQPCRASLIGAGTSVSAEIAIDDEAVSAGLRIVVEMFETGHSPLGARRLIQPVAMVHAMVRSLDRDGEWVDVATMVDREVEAIR